MDVQVLNCKPKSLGYDATDILALVPGYANAIATGSNPSSQVPVALLLHQGANLCAAEFSVLHLKRFFLPIDPANPTNRIETILEDSSADVLVVDETTRHLANKLSCSKVVDLSEVLSDQCQHTALNSFADLIDLSPHDLAYMIYTSGSTGRPKGVPVHWAALDNHNQWFVKEFDLSADDRCTQFFSPGFDVSIQDIFPVLRSGASLYPADKELLTDPYKFFQWIEDNQLTVLSFPTALWHTLVPVLSKRPLPESVRLVLIGGEQVNPHLVKQWLSNVDSKQVRLVNMYGPTEVTIASTFCELTSQQTSAIGKPIDNIQVQLLDKNDAPIIKPGVTGEIVLGGTGVVNGYWNRAQQTRNAFFRSDSAGRKRSYRTGDLACYDANGDLIFVGRKDSQVKLRGFRIELNEVALAVSSHPKIEDVVVRKADGDRNFLICFAVAASNQQPVDDASLEKELRVYLQNMLPDYMIPTAFQFVSQFPLTVGGKVDSVELLRTLDQQNALDDLADRTETERLVCDIWKKVLGHNPVSLDATFEASGGDSLRAMSVVLQLERQFELSGIGLATLAVHNSARTLAAHVDELSSANKSSSRPLVTFMPSPGAEKNRPCLILFHPAGGSGYFYHDLVDEDLLRDFSVVIVESPFLTGEVPTEKQTVAQIARQYFQEVDQHLNAGQQVIAAGYSFGGLLAWEFGKLLEQKNYQIGQVINIDQPVPSEIRSSSIARRLSNWLVRLKYPRDTCEDLRRAKGMDRVRTANRKNKNNQSSELVHLTKVEDFYRAVEEDYTPSANGLDMTLIRGEIFLAKFHLPGDYGWSKITKIRTVCVPGSHSTLFNKRFIGGLRKALFECLNSTV